MDSTLHISISGLTKRYGARLILDEVSLSIDGGKTVALIGPSGGGKSTLLRCLNGLNSFDNGEIRVGEHVLKPSETAQSNGSTIQQMRRLFGMVFQDFQLFPHLSVLENVALAPVRVLGVERVAAEKKAVDLLTRVGLGGHVHAWPHQLSGGQKQRVAIARALAMGPRGLLCDEITSALDPELKTEVLRVLEDLKREGMTLLLVTHELGFARRAADRIVVLAGGKIIEDGPPSQVFGSPKSPRTQQFLSCAME